jgi:hypothetical protein
MKIYKFIETQTNFTKMTALTTTSFSLYRQALFVPGKAFPT